MWFFTKFLRNVSLNNNNHNQDCTSCLNTKSNLNVLSVHHHTNIFSIVLFHIISNFWARLWISEPVAPKPVIAVPPSPQTQVVRGAGRGRGRGYNNHTNRPVPRQVPAQQLQAPASGAPIVQIQQMMGTVYKIVKVRTKEGAIVTKKVIVQWKFSIT